jgi:hypothetical protein
VDIYPNAALGWRGWLMTNQGLRALSMPSCWQPGPNRAECLRRAHWAPAQGCNCGWNAYHSLSSVSVLPGQIAGAIQAGGLVHVHYHGFRAERAEIVALLKPEDWPEEAKQLADHYNVPLFDSAKELKDYLKPMAVYSIPETARPKKPKQLSGFSRLDAH